MRIASVSRRRVEARLTVPLSSSSSTHAERQGLLLQLVSSEGLTAHGEAMPLPDYSPDTLEECEAALSALDASAFAGLDFEHDTAGAVRGWLSAHPLPPAAAFAVETAILDLVAQGTGRPFATLLGSPTLPHLVPLSSLLRADDLPGAAAEALALGRETLKVKVGWPGAFDRELAALRALRLQVGPAIRLRLDANGAFSVAEAPERLAALAEVKPEFIEEPVPPDQLAAFAERRPSPIPLAADESLSVKALRSDLFRAFADGHIAVAVLKPTLLGGCLACLDLVSTLSGRGVRFTVTHAAEGPLALKAAMALASVLPQPVLAAGLDEAMTVRRWDPE